MVLNGDCREQSEGKLRMEITVGKVMGSIFCYSGGTLLVEFRVKCAGVKEVTVTKLKGSATQQYKSIYHHFFRTAPRSK